MTVTREHLAGLKLARSIIEENWPADALLEIVDNCIAEAQSAEPVQGEAVALIVERDIFGTMHIKMPAHDGGEPFDFVQVQYRYPYTDNQSTKRLADQIALLIAGVEPTSPAKPDAELVECLKFARATMATVAENANLRRVEHRSLMSEVKRIDAKLVEPQPCSPDE
jgi:hypothetical protein